ncbi:iron ABC transporter permease [Nocardioides sp. TF02-7]|uniref:ABC transporter permease n=1 Tax=Nocardioides sp. TF02-7 TaxID=2917724 RepID=UPI001F060DDC|nr:iron ABC transporter permease [Nocardioides sp. TF02-7]UMG91259.1 iron ABC transporter permease [Nocardioides sp. TF02-7]
MTVDLERAAPAAPPAPPRRESRIWLVATAVTAVTVLLIVYPLGRTVLGVFGIGADSTVGRIGEVLTSGETWRLALNTVIAVSVGSVVALMIGAVFAWINERTDARMGFAARMLPLMPMFVPSIASAIGWVFLASPKAGVLNGWLRDVGGWFGLEMVEGPLNIYSWPGLIFAYVLFLTPYAYLTISSGLQSLDPALEEASRDAGAGALATFRRITLPSLRPALGASVLVTVTMGVAIFSIPLVIGTPADIDVLPVRIVHMMTHSYPGDIGGALGLSLLVVAAVGGCWLVQRRMLAANAHATITGRSSAEAAVTLGRWKWVARSAMLLFLLLTSVLPLAGLVLVSLQGFWSAEVRWGHLTFDNYRYLVDNELVWAGLRNSLVLAVVCASVAMAVGVLVTLVLARRRGRVASTVDAIVKVPSTLTHIVVALSFIVAFAGPPFDLAGTYLLLAMAYVVLYVPQATFYATAAYHQVGPQLSEASAVSGAGDGTTVRRILLPLMAPGLIAGWSLVFVLMTGDITASSMLAGTHTPVVGFVILDMWTAAGYPKLAALGVLMTLVSSAVVLLVMTLRDKLLVVR